MLWTPQKGRVRVQHNTGATASATMGTVVNNGTTTTKGTPSELIASSSFDAFGIWIMASDNAAGSASHEAALDILVGAATEEVLIPNLLVGGAGSCDVVNRGPKHWFFPLYIPAGTRVAAQLCGLASICTVGVWLFGGCGMPPWGRVGSKVTTYGIGTLPNGVTIAPGASGAEGSWTQITASTTEDHFCLLPSFQIHGDSTQLTRGYQVDLGIGAATEEELYGGWWYFNDTGESMSGGFPTMPYFQDIPSGSRLVMRASNNNTNDTTYNGVIHAVS